jgi:hypothetical protein
MSHVEEKNIGKDTENEGDTALSLLHVEGQHSDGSN